MKRRCLAACWALAIAGVTGCGSDDDEQGPCGTATAPALVTLAGVEPAAGASVANENIVHAFTVVGLRALLEPDFLLTPAHTAGFPDPTQFVVSIDPAGDDVGYTFAPMRWTSAPANVAIDADGVFQTSDGCVYAFPSPLFAYAVTP
jgi:hypothetical protein